MYFVLAHNRAKIAKQWKLEFIFDFIILVFELRLVHENQISILFPKKFPKLRFEWLYSKILCFVHKDMWRLQVLSGDRTPKKIACKVKLIKANRKWRNWSSNENWVMKWGRETQLKAQYEGVYNNKRRQN